MPKDPVSVAHDTLLGDEMETAREWLSSEYPETLNMRPQDLHPILQDAAKQLAAARLAERGGYINEHMARIIERFPKNTMNVGAGTVPFTDKSPMEVIGLGEEDIRLRPSSTFGAFGGIAGTMVPEGAILGKLPGLTGRMLETGMRYGLGGPFTAARKAEQIMGPAAGAAAGGFAGSFADPDLVSPNDDPGSSSSRFANAWNAAKREGLIEAGAGAAGLAATLGKKALAFYKRGGEEHFRRTLESYRLAGLRGEDFGLQEVTNRPIVQAASPMFGPMALPFVSYRFGEAKERISKAVARERDKLVNDVSDGFSTFRRLYEIDPERYGAILRENSQKSFKLVDAAVQRYRVNRSVMSANVNGMVAKENISSAMASTRLTALREFSDDALRRDLPITEVKVGPGMTSRQPMASKGVIRNPVLRTLSEINAIPPGAVPLRQLVNLRDDIKRRLTDISPTNPMRETEKASLLSLRSALDEDIEAAIKAHGSPALQKSWEELSQFDSDWLSLLSGHLGRRGKRIQTTFGHERLSEAESPFLGVEGGSQRRQGSLDMGQFVDTMLKEASPKEIEQFAALMKSTGRAGRDEFRLAAARKLQSVFDAGTHTAGDKFLEVIKKDDVIRAIQGAGGKGGKEEQAFWALMNAAGTDKRKFMALLDSLDTLWKQFPPNTSAYVTRNMMLRQGRDPLGNIAKIVTGGVLGSSVAAGAGAAGAPGGIAGGAGMAVLSLFLMRKFAKIATDPAALEHTIRVLDPRYGSGARAKAVERLLATGVFRQWVNETATEQGAGVDIPDFSQPNVNQRTPAQALDAAVGAFQRVNPFAGP